MTVQNPSGCFTMSTFGPLQKFARTWVASGALNRISTRPVPSTRGYSAPQTLVDAGLKSPASWADATLARNRSANPSCFISPLLEELGSSPEDPLGEVVEGLPPDLPLVRAGERGELDAQAV